MRSYNLGQRLLIDEDGTVCPITDMFDSDGCATDEPDMAVVVVAKRSEGEWLRVPVNSEGDVPANRDTDGSKQDSGTGAR